MKNKNKNFCPLLKKAYDECCSSKMTSFNIVSIIYYCSENFAECKIYKKYTDKPDKKINITSSIEDSLNLARGGD